MSTTLAFVAASAAPGVRAQETELSVVGGSGIPGSTVSVLIRLEHDDAAAAATAALDIDFPIDRIEFNGRVSQSCAVASRLAATHQIGGKLSRPGLLSIDLFAAGLEIHSLGGGELASCAFHILPDAPFGQAALSVALAQLGDAEGQLLHVVGVDGAIEINNGTPTPTSTPTSTPTVTAAECLGDCNGDGQVTIDELVRGVNIALGNLPLSACPVADRNGDGMVTIDELVGAVRIAATTCASAL